MCMTCSITTDLEVYSLMIPLLWSTQMPQIEGVLYSWKKPLVESRVTMFYLIFSQDLKSNYHYWLPQTLSSDSNENFIHSIKFFHLVDTFFCFLNFVILTICLLNSVFTLQGENTSWSFLRVKELNDCKGRKGNLK